MGKGISKVTTRTVKKLVKLSDRIDKWMYRPKCAAIHASQISEEKVKKIETFLFLVEKKAEIEAELPLKDADSIKRFEKCYSISTVEWIEHGHDWAVAFHTNCGNNHVYTQILALKDGHRCTVTAVRRSLRRIQKAREAFCVAYEFRKTINRE